MKLTKFASAAIVAALAVWASSAKASPASYRFERLHFSLIVRQQGLDYSNSAPSTYVSTVKAMKITTQDLLNFLADAFNTSWPTNAQLALDNNSRDIFVVDGTGTNPLFNASSGISLGETNVAWFRFDSDDAAFAGETVEQTPGKVDFTEYRIISFHLYRYDDADPSVYTDLSFQGYDKAKSAGSWDSVTGSTAVSDNAHVSGDGDMGDTWTVLHGHVTGAGKWKGLPPT